MRTGDGTRTTFEVGSRNDPFVRPAGWIALDDHGVRRLVHKLVDEASGGELRIIGLIAYRMIEVGARAYGMVRIDDDRDDTSEAVEEFADACFYMAKRVLRLAMREDRQRSEGGSV